MVGYWMKNIDENHFQFVHHNVSGGGNDETWHIIVC
jgi:hypothetical protein